MKAEVVITHPKAIDNAKDDLEGSFGDISYIEDPYEAVAGCCAIATMTEWSLYRDLDYREIYGKMAKPAFIFDGRNVLDYTVLHEIGFNVFPIGPPLTHF